MKQKPHRKIYSKSSLHPSSNITTSDSFSPNNILQWRIQGGAPPACTPPTTQIFLNFVQFFGKFGKIICWCPLEDWRPLLWGILDPPMLNAIYLNFEIRNSYLAKPNMISIKDQSFVLSFRVIKTLQRRQLLKELVKIIVLILTSVRKPPPPLPKKTSIRLFRLLLRKSV